MAKKKSSAKPRPPRPRVPPADPALNPAESTEAGALGHFATHKPDCEVDYIAFDGVIDGFEIYELWYFEYRQWCVSFVTFSEASGYGYVDSIAKLLMGTARRRNALERQLELMRSGRIRLYVASVAFILSLVTLIAIAFRSEDKGTAVLLTIMGVVSSGALFFFGAWVPGGLFSRPVRKES